MRRGVPWRIRNFSRPYGEEQGTTELQKQSQRVKEALARAVAEALDRKRRLGQYAVVYENGRPVRIEPGSSPGQAH
jgi:hypothetical protein